MDPTTAGGRGPRPDTEPVAPSVGGALGHLSITAKLASIVVVFVLVAGAQLALAIGALEFSNGVRAYVGGEGLWSKGQKDAVRYLSRYLRTRDEADYRRYREAVAIPLGDRQARLEMEKADFDYAVAESGFIQGGNAPEDVPYLVFLFRHFRDVPHLRAAVDIWTRADDHIAALVALGDEAHRHVADGTLTPERERRLLDGIEHINTVVTPLEVEFSNTLGQGARWLRNVLLALMLACTAALLGAGLLVAWRVSHALRDGILRLREGALRVSGGDLDHPIEVRTRDELGELAGVFNQMIEHRREVESALRNATEFREKVMQSASNSITALDLGGCFTLVNRRTTELTGYEAAELIGRSYEVLVPDPRREEVARLFRSVVEEGRSIHDYELAVRRKDGRLVDVRLSCAPLMKEGRISGVAATAEDITERKRAEAELAARAAELARSNRELEQFAYVASHDLQEPLRTVTSYAQLLVRRQAAGAEHDEYVGFIREAVLRMRALIDGLLDYSRVSGARLEVQETDLNAVLDTALQNLREAISSSGGAVTSDSLPALPVNAGQISRVFQNLVGNGLKFRGEEAPRVHVSAQRRGGEWVLTVRDNGIGIEPRHAEKIFSLYQRLHARDRFPGNGIGLALCKKIVEAHGGRIWVEPGQPGSVFCFTLPASADTRAAPVARTADAKAPRTH